ncbi:MAG: 2-amino-4-hydroxy-6-hydroxymethyldihydropteridine diphosphokinase [Pseudomonadales bacterium]
MNDQHLVYLSLGSNIDREHYIARALDELSAQYGSMDISPVYESAAFGFEGDPFYNLVVGLYTDERLRVLMNKLKQIESNNDRTRDGGKFSSRTLDIDILTYNQLSGVHEQMPLPRPEIFKQAYVLAPFADIAPGFQLPNATVSLATLWCNFDQARQPLTRIPFAWQGLNLPAFQLNKNG